MFGRVVAVNTKEGKARQLAKTIQEQVLPILQNQPVSWTRLFSYPTAIKTKFWR